MAKKKPAKKEQKKPAKKEVKKASKKETKKSSKKDLKKKEEEIPKEMPGKLGILGMEGAISNYKRGRHTLHPKQCILVFPSVQSRKDANKLMGRTVAWVSGSGKELKGVITRAHGNSGAVRALFKHAGLPGQALGTKISFFYQRIKLDNFFKYLLKNDLFKISIIIAKIIS